MTAKADSKHLLPTAWKICSSMPFPFVAEKTFHPTRKWRFDWADQTRLVAVEVEGVTYFGKSIGRHQSAGGIEGDCEKYNAAIELGWVVLRYSQRMLKSAPAGIVEQIERVLELRS